MAMAQVVQRLPSKHKASMAGKCKNDFNNVLFFSTHGTCVLA
jgi:hypothetical protein